MAKVDLSLKLVYANNLYQEIIRNTIEDYNPGDFTTLLLWLDSHNVIIGIDYEFYKEGISWLWSIDFYNPENKKDDCIGYGTAVFGDNGEYKTRSEALCISIIRALELYLLGSIKCGKVFSEDELFINDIDPEISLFDIQRYIEENTYNVIVDEEWDLLKRRTAKEFINYIKERILKCLEKLV